MISLFRLSLFFFTGCSGSLSSILMGALSERRTRGVSEQTRLLPSLPAVGRVLVAAPCGFSQGRLSCLRPAELPLSCTAFHCTDVQNSYSLAMGVWDVSEFSLLHSGYSEYFVLTSAFVSLESMFSEVELLSNCLLKSCATRCVREQGHGCGGRGVSL